MGSEGEFVDERVSIATPLVAERGRSDDEVAATEETLSGVQVPKWSEQITVRGFVVSVLLGAMFSIIIHKLNFIIGVIPSLNVGAGLLGFFFVKSWTALLSQAGVVSRPFTRQENTVIQTTTVACYELAFSGGFGSYLLAMDQTSYEIIGEDYPGNDAEDVKNPSLGWIIAFFFVISFVGLLALVPLRKIMVFDYALTYPSGTATAMLINSFHSTQGAETAKKQVRCLGNYFTFSFFWSLFKWFFSGAGDSCGFDNFPSFGKVAFANRIYFDFSLAYIGAGMICPHLVNISAVFGALLSWGIMWPLIRSKGGDWFPDGLGSTDLKGVYGYQVFISIALVLGDGMYNFSKISFMMGRSLYLRQRKNLESPLSTGAGPVQETPDEEKRKEVFLSEGVPLWIAISGYVTLSVISIVLIPLMFPSMRWYFVALCYVVAPLLAFCNSYGTGLTDCSLGTTYGKLVLFIFASWAGKDGGVMAGLVSCGIIFTIVSSAADLMQDFKTGYLTLSSPKSMFVSQVLGTACGCIVAPLTFWIFWKAFDLGSQSGEYKVPNAIVFREMAIVGKEGLSALPDYCVEFVIVAFVLAVLINLIRDLGPAKYTQFIPLPMAMAVPFYIGAYFAVDMFVGTVIRFVWEKMNRKEADLYAGVLASGLICGDGIWTLPAAVLSMLKIDPPLCMTFIPTRDTAAGLRG